MERSELIAKLSKAASETTPDIYNRIIKAAKSEGLINANWAGPSASGGGGSSVNGCGACCRNRGCDGRSGAVGA